MKLFLLLFLLFLPLQSFATYDQYQTELIQMAYNEGQKYNLGDTMVAILLQETKAGKMGKIHDNDKTFGVMCVKVSTAQDMLEMKYEYCELRTKLIHDDKFNIKLATIYVNYLKQIFNDIDYAILAYNVGMGRVKRHGIGFDPNNYLKSVKSKIRAYNTSRTFGVTSRIRITR